VSRVILLRHYDRIRSLQLHDAHIVLARVDETCHPFNANIRDSFYGLEADRGTRRVTSGSQNPGTMRIQDDTRGHEGLAIRVQEETEGTAGIPEDAP